MDAWSVGGCPGLYLANVRQPTATISRGNGDFVKWVRSGSSVPTRFPLAASLVQLSMQISTASRTHWLATASAVLLVVLANPAAAVIIHSGDGSGNTTAPPDDPGWDQVGQYKTGSAIYVGDRWVLTANHLGNGGTATLLGESFNLVAGSEKQLLNPPSSGLTTLTDLKLFQIDRDPGLPPLVLGTAPPPVGGLVSMIGRGRNRETDLTYWSIAASGEDRIWTETTGPTQSDAAGYHYASGQTMRWGANRIENDTAFDENDNDPDHNADVTIQFAGESFDIVSLITVFDESGGTAFEAQGATGDSGGAVFYNNGNQWELAGVILAVSNFLDQPGGTAALGNLTMFADVSVYGDQIEAITSVVAPFPISLNGYGQAYVQDFDDLGSVGTVLPDGWVARNNGLTNLTITEPFPSTTVASGTYDAGSGGDRALATGNTDATAPNRLELWAKLTDATDVRAVRLVTRIEAWGGDPDAESPGEAAFRVSLHFDPDGSGMQNAVALSGGAPIGTGLVLEPGWLDGNGPHGTSLDSGIVEVNIPAGSDLRLSFDAQNAGATQGYLFGLDDAMLRIVAAGDTDGDGDVESDDLFDILAAGKFNHPELGPADWSEGDFNGDDLVTSADLFRMLAASQFNAGTYTSTGSVVLAVPEPHAFFLAAVGLACLLAYAGRRRCP